jgi:hypothetical protein
MNQFPPQPLSIALRAVSNFFVSLIPVVHLDLQIFCKFSKIFETVLTGYSGAGGNSDSWKKPEAKNLVTLSL